MTSIAPRPDTAADIMPAGVFRAGAWWINEPKQPMAEYPAGEMEILPPRAYPPPARLPPRPAAPRPVRDELPDGTFH